MRHKENSCEEFEELLEGLLIQTKQNLPNTDL